MTIIKNPKVWGPPLWDLLHFLTFKYNSKEDREIYRKLFCKWVMIIIPCPPCQKHYKERIERIPINLSSREKLSRWLVNLHNDVNKELKKPRFSYEKALLRYRNNNKNKTRIKNSFVQYTNIMRNYINSNVDTQNANSNLTKMLMKHL
ncbi:putative ERV/ALR sulphydryl oxidase [Aureococcus anophagefferens virus]|uniref:Sulfhydryl oxidase n=1 Tax=Aureococcus anophagefferens virus TaxID=1474867 RepID=A0A076FGJ1_9VIRU|nr:putative ERV/ALR sulphydryl oxidase [Aureococcus anophagefferens virus]AII17200.1 putative ERV/ALR sulphydryl oxidase [Aureococcus anophagefferens virus]UOG94204.1 Erv1 / Alr family [Aureococcus anophagefferens virus]